MTRLFVFGYFGGRNFGDELMLLGLIADARAAGVSTIRIVTPDGQMPRHLVGKVEGAHAKSISGLVAGIIWADAFAICGGTMFHDSFSDDRYRTYRKTLFALAGLCLFARTMGCKVLLWGIGLGPLRRRMTRLTARVALMVAHDVICRDANSYQDAASLIGRSRRLKRGRDLAYSAKDIIPRASPEEPPRLAVSAVSPALVSLAAPADAEMFIAGLTDALATFLTSHPRWRITILAVAVGAFDHDLDAVRSMDSLVKSFPDRVDVQAFSGDPHTLLELLASTRAVVASRFHVATAAELIGTPTIWLPYQRKVLDATLEMDVPKENVIVPVSSNIPAIFDQLNKLADK